MVQCSEDGSSEGDVEERPSTAEASAALAVLANIALLEGADKTTWKLCFFKASTGIVAAKIIIFLELKCSFVGVLSVDSC